MKGQQMPVVPRWNGHRFLFYSKETGEPPHIHILKDDMQIRVWLADLRVARNEGFAAHQVNDILRVVNENRDMLLEAWNDYFGY